MENPLIQNQFRLEREERKGKTVNFEPRLQIKIFLKVEQQFLVL